MELVITRLYARRNGYRADDPFIQQRFVRRGLSYFGNDLLIVRRLVHDCAPPTTLPSSGQLSHSESRRHVSRLLTRQLLRSCYETLVSRGHLCCPFSLSFSFKPRTFSRSLDITSLSSAMS